MAVGESAGQDVVEVGGAVFHVPAGARGAQVSSLAAEGHNDLVATALAQKAGETRRGNSTGEVGGRGFAVVAREIRSLADQSVQSTVRVRDLLNDITTAIRESVQTTQLGANRIEVGLKRSP